MKSSGAREKLRDYDSLFGSQDVVIYDPEQENVQEIPITELHSFQNHPFKVIDDAAMESMVESIKVYGVLTPAIARQLDSGGYEIVAGHRRKRGCELAGLETMPVIVRQMSDDEAIILMCDTNIQRECILPSERAFAYEMKLEAMKRQAGRPTKENGSQVGNNSLGQKSSDMMAEQIGESKNQIFRFIRLTKLVPPLLEMVDVKKVAFNPAVELSYLKPEEQVLLLDAMESEQISPSLSQAQRLKKFSQEGNLTKEAMSAIMTEEQKEVSKLTLSREKLTRYFPKEYTPQQMESTILELLEQWQQNRHRDLAG